MTFDEINDATGFANGSKFANAQEVRDYFTVANLNDMFMGDSKAAQAELDAMAKKVIANGWHMTATKNAIDIARNLGQKDGSTTANDARDAGTYSKGSSSDWDASLINTIGLRKTRELFGLAGKAIPNEDPEFAEALKAYNEAAIEAYDAEPEKPWGWPVATATVNINGQELPISLVQEKHLHEGTVYRWYDAENNDLEVSGKTLEEALEMARQRWGVRFELEVAE